MDEQRTILIEELAFYLIGGQSFSDFWQWLCRETVEIEQWAPPELCDLVYEIRLMVAEYTRGDRTKESLDKELLRIHDEG